MAKIVIRNVQELKQFQTKVKIVKAALPFLRKSAITKVSNETVLEKIKQRMKQNNFSQKIIDATFVGRTDIFGSIARTHFISNYVSETGFDVSDAREEGTKSGVTRRPKKPNGVLRWIGKAGEVIFRKKSTPKGIERLLIIEKTLKESENDMATNVNDEVGKEAAKIFGV